MRAPIVRRRARTTSARGQGVVEFAMILPAILILLLGVLEFGFAFDHHLTLEYATREGARTGAALANGGNPPGCGAGQSPARQLVDPLIVAAVERVLTSPGSPVAVDQVSRITIYRADANGNATGDVNVWDYSQGAGPSVGGTRLDFAPASAGLGDTSGWRSCARDNTWDRRTTPWAPPDSLGVSITYTYRPVTALSAVMGFFGGGRGSATIEMRDRSVMVLNPDDR
jgi:Flp pilus assembly protein TadG